MTYQTDPIFVQTPCKGFQKIWNYNHSSMVAQLLYTGATNGSQLQKFWSVHTSTLAINYFPFLAIATTLQANMGTGAFVSGSPVTITRSSGSFVTDGWQVGDLCWVNGATTFGNGLIDVVSAVAAGTLTLTQNTIFTAENLPSGAVMYRVYPVGNVLLAVATAQVPVLTNLLTSTVIPSVLSASDAYLTIPSGIVLGLKISRTGQGITDVTASLGASATAWASICGEVADF
jgi:hypothetical protein